MCTISTDLVWSILSSEHHISFFLVSWGISMNKMHFAFQTLDKMNKKEEHGTRFKTFNLNLFYKLVEVVELSIVCLMCTHS